MIKIFWLLLSLGCVIWYLVVLGYVAYKGAVEIKAMLKGMMDKDNETGSDTFID